MKQLFELGTCVCTNGVSEELRDLAFETFVAKSLLRHQTGDWGDLCNEDKEN